MDVDLDRPHDEEEMMEYEEDGAAPSADIAIDNDATLEDVLRDDEVMTTDPQPVDPSTGIPMPISVQTAPFGAVSGEGDEMQPEPTPIIRDDAVTDPFFVPIPITTASSVPPADATPLAGTVVDINLEDSGAIVGGSRGPSIDSHEAIPNPQPGEVNTEEAHALGSDPVSREPHTEASAVVNSSTDGGPSAQANGAHDRARLKPGNAVASSSSSSDTSSSSSSDLNPESKPALGADFSGQEAHEYPVEAQEEYLEDEEYEEGVDEQAVIEPDETAEEAVPSADHIERDSIIAPTDNIDDFEEGDEEQVDLVEEDILGDQTEAGEPLDDMLTIHSLPCIILHLPHDPPRSLFFPLDTEDGLPDGISAATPVWFADRHSELALAPISQLMGLMKEEVEKLRGKRGKEEGKELMLEERGLGLKLGEHDKHLDKLTLLEFLQVHHSCELPTPVQLFLSFQPSRFWDRFEAIRRELVAQAEQRVSVAGEKEPEAMGADDGEDEAEEGYASDAEKVSALSGISRDRSDVINRSQEQGSGHDATEPVALRSGDSGKANPPTRSPPAETPGMIDHDAGHDKGVKGRSDAALGSESNGEFGVIIRSATPRPSTDSLSLRFTSISRRIAKNIDPNMRIDINNPPLDEMAQRQAEEGTPGSSDAMTALTGNPAGVIGTSFNPKDEIALKDDREAAIAVEDEALHDDTQEGGEAEEYDEEEYDDDGNEVADSTAAPALVVDASSSQPSSLLSTATPLGDVELAKENGVLSPETPSIPPDTTAASSNSFSAIPTPAASELPSDSPLGHSRLSQDITKELISDELENDVDEGSVIPTTIPEVEEAEEHEDEDDEVDDDGDLGIDVDAIVDQADRNEPKDHIKKALTEAVDSGDVSEEVAKEVVGEEVWEEEYEGDDGIVVANEVFGGDTVETEDPLDPANPYAQREAGTVSPESSTVQDDEEVDDQGYYIGDEEEPGDDADLSTTLSTKRLRSDEISDVVGKRSRVEEGVLISSKVSLRNERS